MTLRRQLLRSIACAAATGVAVGAAAQNGLDVRLLKSGPERRFIGPQEWGVLGTYVDCRDQERRGFGPAKHPVIRKVTGPQVFVWADGGERMIHAGPSAEAGRKPTSGYWVASKVVCGSRGFAILYVDVHGYNRFVLKRFGSDWRVAGTETFSLPLPHSRMRLVWRLAERAGGYELVMLDYEGNKDQTIDRAEYIALARHEFFVAKPAGMAAGYADRPGPALTGPNLDATPVEVRPGLTVPRDIERHDLELGNWSGTMHIRVDIPDRPLFLRLRSYHPVDWVITPTPSTRIHAVFLYGPSPQNVTGLGEGVAVLIGGTGEHRAIAVLTTLTEPARSRQVVPAHRKDELVLIDGKMGATAPTPPSHPYHPSLTPEVSGDVRLRIANCATLKDQDERIECYRQRAETLHKPSR